MTVADVDVDRRRKENLTEARYEVWTSWPVNWSAVWVGALAAIAVLLVFGLVGIAVGAHVLAPESRVVDLKKISIEALAFSVFGAFLAFVAGGWIAGKIAGILRSEPGMLHGAIVFLVAAPILVVLSAVGTGSYFGSWYAGLSSTSSARVASPYERPEPLADNATEKQKTDFQAAQTEYREQMQKWREDTPKATRNSALCALTALLLGLVGGVIGGWMASGEPMTFSHHHVRRYA